MTASLNPIVEIEAVRKEYGGAQPLQLSALRIGTGDRLVLLDADVQQAEMLMHLITAAAVPDEGTVRIAGRDTRAITTDTDWLESLDRFGIVTHRAVLIEKISVASNLALPITLAIDPMSAETRRAVDALAAAVGLTQAQLDGPASDLDRSARARLHLARALALSPALLLLEHPTDGIDDAAARVSFGRTLSTVSATRQIGWLALSRHADFARASGGRVRRWNPASGELRRPSVWQRLTGG